MPALLPKMSVSKKQLSMASDYQSSNRLASMTHVSQPVITVRRVAPPVLLRLILENAPVDDQRLADWFPKEPRRRDGIAASSTSSARWCSSTPPKSTGSF